MADSYPWSNPDLFVKQSPLFNADKIHTPLLFLHGDADVNVPVGESIQMFTALKLLGRETAFVAVTGQDHHIVDYGKSDPVAEYNLCLVCQMVAGRCDLVERYL